MENANSILWEVSIWEFLLVTVILAGGAAYLTGRAVALSWLTMTHLALYILLLNLATRFIHFALFEGSLLSIQYFLVDFVVLLAIAFLGFRTTRGKQMARQYRFRTETPGEAG